jgi:CRISPR type III-A-associated RAMP protein Csm4
MTSALLIWLHPSGPWRFGPGEGGRDRVDALFRSDRLFSAFTLAFERLGMMEPWLEATARAGKPAVVFSSLFPFQGDTQFIPPPATLWPPPAGAVRVSSPVFATKVRWRAARFVPVSLVENLLLGQRILAEQWTADAESGCLLRRDRPQSSPFRAVTRSYAAVDRLGTAAETHSLAGVEFEQGSGLWAVAAFESEDATGQWKDPLLAALRLLADTGLGGRRSSGWGQVASFRSQEGSWPGVLLPKLSRAKSNGRAEDAAEQIPAHWMLSLFRPGSEDEVDWSEGDYSLTVRGGHVESSHGCGAPKKQARMVEEGSVIVSPRPPLGSAVDVSPEGFAHPVYRSGFALSVALPVVNFGRSEEPETELEKALDEALKAASEESSAEPESLPEIVGHAGGTEQSAPQTAFDEAPALPEGTELPERLNIEHPPVEEPNEPNMSNPESTEEEPGDEV